MVSWLGFGIASTVTKSFMHFLPAAAGIGAPYPVDLKVTVGGSALPRRTLTVEGARLGHPDGFRLEEAVPALNQQVSGMYLLQVDLAPSQQRVDLSTSGIIIELQYQQGAVRYLPRRINSHIEGGKAKSLSGESQTSGTLGSIMARGVFNPDAGISTGFALRDPTLFASIVILNSTASPIVARIYSSRMEESVGTVTIAPDSVKECDLVELGLTRATKLDCTWGAVEVEAFRVSFENPPQLAEENPSNLDAESKASQAILGAAAAAYVVYRDRNSRRISSVVAL